MTPRWARRRTLEEQRAFEHEQIAAEVCEWAALGPREIGRRLVAMAPLATAAARRSPYWEAASAPEPLAPGDAARWLRLVREHGGRPA